MNLPTIMPITRRFIDHSEVKERVRVVSTDVLRDQLEGPYHSDVLRALIQVLSPKDAASALKKRGILVPGGSIYTMGRMVYNTRLSPISWVGFSLITLNRYNDGQAYTQE